MQVAVFEKVTVFELGRYIVRANPLAPATCRSRLDNLLNDGS